MDDVTWGALTLVLTALGAAYTWWALRHRGLAPGMRGLALTLLPAAAWLTGTSRMFGEIASSVASWATHLVFSPVVWAGVGLTALSVVLFVAAGAIDSRRPPTRGASRAVTSPTPPSSKGVRAPAPDDEFGDIEELLRRRGIE